MYALRTYFSDARSASNRPFASFFCFKTSPVKNLYENDCYSQVHFSKSNTNHLNGFAPGLVLKQRQNATRKWPNSITIIIGFQSLTEVHFNTHLFTLSPHTINKHIYRVATSRNLTSFPRPYVRLKKPFLIQQSNLNNQSRPDECCYAHQSRATFQN